MKKKNIKNKIKGQGEVNMSLYEINQGIIGQLPAYTEEQLKELEEKINDWTSKSGGLFYFMLLGRDKNYYTIFQNLHDNENEFSKLGQAVVNVLIETDYTIHSDEILEDHCEIWVKDEEGTYAFMLFPYDEGVVYYG